MGFVEELSKKEGLKFDIDVKRSPQTGEWNCALRFDGYDLEAGHNAAICQFLERFKEEKERLKSGNTDQNYYDLWFERQMAYYSPGPIYDKKERQKTRARLEAYRTLLQK